MAGEMEGLRRCFTKSAIWTYTFRVCQDGQLRRESTVRSRRAAFSARCFRSLSTSKAVQFLRTPALCGRFFFWHFQYIIRLNGLAIRLPQDLVVSRVETPLSTVVSTELSTSTGKSHTANSLAWGRLFVAPKLGHLSFEIRCSANHQAPRWPARNSVVGGRGSIGREPVCPGRWTEIQGDPPAGQALMGHGESFTLDPPATHEELG